MNVLFQQYLMGALYLIIAAGFVWMGKFFQSRISGQHYNADYAVVEESSLAVALRESGRTIGLVLGLLGALHGESLSAPVDEIVRFAINGVVCLSFLMISQAIVNHVTLPALGNTHEIARGNTAVGWVEFGTQVATGLIVYGAMVGTGTIASTVLSFVLGQIALVLIVKAHERFTSIDWVNEIKSRNAAAGVHIGCMSIAIGVLLMRSIVGDSEGLLQDSRDFLIAAATSFALVVLLERALECVLLPKSSLRTEIVRDHNIAGVMLLGVTRIALFATVGFAL